MASADYDVRVTPSLLDRLLDQDHQNTRDVMSSRAESVRELKRAVRRDLEALLNSRNSFSDLPEAFSEARQSVLTYGLPDFSSFWVGDEAGQTRLRQLIEAAIRTFEPRLTGVTASLLPTEATGFALYLRIDARLVLDPTPEPVSFDIMMPEQATSCQVKESG